MGDNGGGIVILRGSLADSSPWDWDLVDHARPGPSSCEGARPDPGMDAREY